jgi:hypothetical protein
MLRLQVSKAKKALHSLGSQAAMRQQQQQQQQLIMMSDCDVAAGVDSVQYLLHAQELGRVA